MAINAYLEREKRADLRAGVIAASVINMTPMKNRRKPVSPVDLFPSLKEIRPPQSPEQQQKILTAIGIMSGSVRHESRERIAEMANA
jgi:hypothetical protein